MGPRGLCCVVGIKFLVQGLRESLYLLGMHRGGWVGVSCIYLCCTHRVGPRRLLHTGQGIGGAIGSSVPVKRAAQSRVLTLYARGVGVSCI